MPTNHERGDVGAHGSTIRAEPGRPRPSFATCRTRMTPGAVPGGWSSPDARGQKVQSAGSDVAGTDRAVGFGKTQLRPRLR